MNGCQADQLAVAVRSPISTEEDEQQGGVTPLLGSPLVSGLIGERSEILHTETITATRSGPFPLRHSSGIERVPTEE